MQGDTCNNIYQKSKVVPYAHNTYTMFTDGNQHIVASTNDVKKYPCKKNLRRNFSNVECVCCKRCVPLHKTEWYVSTDYDFSIFVVCALLSARPDERNSTDASQMFICNVCKTCLSKTNNISAPVPIYSRHRIARSGAQFLKGLQEKPEYICTCCQSLLFRRSVAQTSSMLQISL